jgi:hypothetical protein
MHQVDLSFLCTAHRVSERALQSALFRLMVIDGSAISIESLAEAIDYSTDQTKRAIQALAWHDPKREIAPIVRREGGTRGRPYRYLVDRDRGRALGLINDAA